MKEQRIAYIDLSAGEISKAPIPERMRRMYLGGRGIDAYLLYNHIPPGIDPLGPENVLVVSAGLLGGTPAPSSGRCNVGAKSPLTNLLGSTNMGGFFAPELRFAGFDHLVIKGKAEKPVYLWIHDGEIEIRDATHLWGKDTGETPAIIRKEHQDEDIKVMSIGVAGENLVRFANVITGLKNAGGRTGMGCVMGSKNLKAIAVRGTQDLPIAYPEEALDYLAKLTQMIRDNFFLKVWSTLGTPSCHSDANNMGRLRYRNLQRNQDPAGENLYAENLQKFTFGMAGCFGCPIHCRHRYVVPEGPDKGNYMEGPDWSTMAGIGTELDINRMEAVLVGNQLSSKYGLDSLEFGGMVSWAIELYEKGIIDDRTTGGLKLEWGNENVMYEMMRQIAMREGLGNILAEGPLRAIEKLGEESRYYNVHVKGMSWLHTDDRATPAMALGVATSTRGADHMRSRPGTDALIGSQEDRDRLFGFAVPPDFTCYEGAGKLVRYYELMYTVPDALGMCKFQTLFMSPATLSYEEYSRLVRHVSGLAISASEMNEAAERIYTMERMFNVREGATRKDDYPPERLMTEPTPATGILSFQRKVIDREKYEQQLDEYYQAHGWDEKGIPKPETLGRLGLDKEPSHLL